MRARTWSESSDLFSKNLLIYSNKTMLICTSLKKIIVNYLKQLWQLWNKYGTKNKILRNKKNVTGHQVCSKFSYYCSRMQSNARGRKANVVFLLNQWHSGSYHFTNSQHITKGRKLIVWWVLIIDGDPTLQTTQIFTTNLIMNK